MRRSGGNLNGSGLGYRVPKGAQNRCSVPAAVSADAPMAIVNLNFLQHFDGKDGGVRHDLNRIEYAHYLVGEGKGADDSLPEMFTESAPDTDFAAKWLRKDPGLSPDHFGWDGVRWKLADAWCVDIMRRQLIQEPRQYRLMVSPEPKCGRLLDKDAMRDFGTELMSRVSKDCHRELLWVGAGHFNTDNPHIHVGIRGMSANHEPVFFSPHYIREGFKRRAREILYERFGSAKELRRAG